MEKKFKSLFITSLFISAVFIFGIFQTALAGDLPCATGPTIITLDGDTIAPDTLRVKLGNTIIWLNKGPGPATIKFTTRIGLACAAPVNFYADLLGNYETTQIPPNGTASICLIEEGDYHYEVRRLKSIDDKAPVEFIKTGKVISVK